MTQIRVLAMNLIALVFPRLSGCVFSWSKGINDPINRIRPGLLPMSSVAFQSFSTGPISPGESTSSPVREMGKIYILRFGSHIHKHSKDTGIAIAIYDADDGKKLWTGRRFIPIATAGEKNTSNIADYMALVDGLKAINTLQNIQTLSSPCRVEIQTSNRVIAKHLSKEFNVATASLKPWYESVTKLMNGFQEATTGQIPSTDCSDIRKASELAIKEQKSCENYLTIIKGADSTNANNNNHLQENNISAREEPNDAVPALQTNPLQNQSYSSSTTDVSPDKVYILRFDGGSRGNPGVAGSGMALYDSEDGSEIWSGCLYLGDHRTNNEAEYMGLITGMQCALSLGVKQIVVQGDSKLVLEQIALRWKVKSPTLKYYFEQAVALKNQFTYFETSHIERARNARADELANEAMDTRLSRGFDS